MGFYKILGASLKVLQKNPKLFLPKFLVSFLYGIGMLVTASVIRGLSPILQKGINISAAELAQLQQIMPVLLLLVVYTFIVLIVDLIVNAMYPPMINDYISSKKISFSKSLSYAVGKTAIVLPAVLLTILVFAVLALPFMVLFSYFQLMNFAIGMFLSLVALMFIIFVTTLAFYLIYPVAVLDARSSLHAIKRSLALSVKNFHWVSKASLVQFQISLLSLLLAFLSERIEALALFIATRFLIALLSTYAMVLNPMLYFHIKERALQP